MIQKLLGTYSNDKENQKLYLEISKEQFACWTMNSEEGSLQNFELFQFKKVDDFATEFKNILIQSHFLQKLDQDQKVIVIWDNENAQLIPKKFANNLIEKSLLQNTVNANDTNSDILLTIETEEYEVNYDINSQIKAVLETHFPNIKHRHKYDCISKVLSRSVAKSYLSIHVMYFQEHCILSAVQDGKIQFIKRIHYLSPLDPVYFILNACNQYQQKIDDTKVKISGLITYESPLYEALTKYIPNIDVEEVTKNIFDPEIFSEHPEHYFVPFLKYSI